MIEAPLFDIVHFHDSKNSTSEDFLSDEDGWYFWDETYANRYGPYETRKKLKKN